jgi:hypothetical protein
MSAAAEEEEVVVEKQQDRNLHMPRLAGCRSLASNAVIAVIAVTILHLLAWRMTLYDSDYGA